VTDFTVRTVPLVGIMAKAPRAGHAKTRLARALAPEIAADMYRNFLMDTVEIVRRVPDVKAVLVCPQGDKLDLLALDLGLPVLEQDGPGLMHGLAYGIAHGLDLGYPAVALINADSPTLPPDLIAGAVAALDTHDVVLGPTADGGYYLIAASVPCTALLCDEPYPNGETICRDTLARAQRLGLRAATVAPWFDIDLPSELAQLASALQGLPPHVARHTRRGLQRHQALLDRFVDATT
jgi:rSAM/selenodomain-associated transferase 1